MDFVIREKIKNQISCEKYIYQIIIFLIYLYNNKKNLEKMIHEAFYFFTQSSLEKLFFQKQVIYIIKNFFNQIVYNTKEND